MIGFYAACGLASIAGINVKQTLEQLEILASRLDALLHDLDLEIQSLEQRQIDETKPVLEQLESLKIPAREKLDRLKEEETEMRHNFDKIAYKTAAYKKTQKAAQDLCIEKAGDVDGSLEKHREMRSKAFADLESKLMERNFTNSQLESLNNMCVMLTLPHRDRDYPNLVACSEYEPFTALCGSKNAGIVVARLKLLQYYKDTQETDMDYVKDATFALERVRSKIVDLACYYWR